jgi:hypothetical protein
MTTDWIAYRENTNIDPLVLGKKEEYYRALDNVVRGWSGRLDVLFVNEFVRESIQLVINAIVLFEKGYFDCAFYSLRQSLEVSTTAAYFVDDTEENRNQEISRWRRLDKFPMHKQMTNELQKRKLVFADIKEKMSQYFAELEDVKQVLNKYVHKQGYDKFYVLQNHPLNSSREKDRSVMISDFEHCLVKSIGAIAILRLVVDPLPVLLMDEDIFCRTGDLMTEGYDDAFVEKYIGLKHLEAYRNTEMFKSFYNSLMANEKMTDSVVRLVKYGIIARKEIDEILLQKHLLPVHDLTAVVLTAKSNKIANIYCFDGWHWYNTDIESVRKNNLFASRDFHSEKFTTQLYNLPYEEAYLSMVSAGGENYCIEHNEKFDFKEYEELVECAAGAFTESVVERKE